MPYYYQYFYYLDILLWIFSIVFLICLIIISIEISFRAHKKAIVSGEEALIGMEGVIISVHKEKVTIRLLGEIWEGVSTTPVHPSQSVEVIKVKGLSLTVRPINQPH